jgi:cell volume regulation protein A
MPAATLDSLQIFSEAALLVSAAMVLAVLGRLLAERVLVPTAALLLLAAAAFSDVFSGVGDVLTFEDVQWIASVALVVILFDGGLHIGQAKFRRSVAEITALGVVGTFATAGLLAVAAHTVLGFSWTTSGLLGAALAPTDPAVTFSVLGAKEVGGRSGTILEGESGFNDPVGIALMIGLVELATTDDGSFSLVISEFAVEMSIGLAFGLAGGLVLTWALRHIALPQALTPIWALAIVGVIFGLTGVLHGSGFLAVFIAGVMVGDLVAPAWEATEQFVRALANLAELAVFVALGLTVSLGSIVDDLWWQGLALAALLAFVIRPLVATPLLLPARLTWGERGFIVWSGLKGAVPILLASLAVVGGASEAEAIYGIVFVVVFFSVVVQGTGLPLIASVLGVPMEDARDRGRPPPT